VAGRLQKTVRVMVGQPAAIQSGVVAKNVRFMPKTGRLPPLISYREVYCGRIRSVQMVSLPGRTHLFCVHWYLRYALSYRDLEEMMRERGLSVDHTTIYRWVQAYAPELEKRIRPHLRPTNDSYRVDETYIRVKARGNIFTARSIRPARRFDLLLSAKETQEPPNGSSARCSSFHNIHSIASQLRRCKYLNNIVEQGHRFIKRQVNPRPGFFSFKTARRTIGGYEAMSMLRKGQVEGIGKGDIQGQVR
jgi:transposase, IS6 family